LNGFDKLYDRREALTIFSAATATSVSSAAAENVKKIAFALNGTPGDVG
jgi:hypothetical protein